MAVLIEVPATLVLITPLIAAPVEVSKAWNAPNTRRSTRMCGLPVPDVDEVAVLTPVEPEAACGKYFISKAALPPLASTCSLMPDGGFQVVDAAPTPCEVMSIVLLNAVVTLGVACEVLKAVFCPFSTSMAGSAPENAIMPPAAPVWPLENVQV